MQKIEKTLMIYLKSKWVWFELKIKLKKMASFINYEYACCTIALLDWLSQHTYCTDYYIFLPL